MIGSHSTGRGRRRCWLFWLLSEFSLASIVDLQDEWHADSLLRPDAVVCRLVDGWLFVTNYDWRWLLRLNCDTILMNAALDLSEWLFLDLLFCGGGMFQLLLFFSYSLALWLDISVVLFLRTTSITDVEKCKQSCRHSPWLSNDGHDLFARN